jgi:hypothetical protein
LVHSPSPLASHRHGLIAFLHSPRSHRHGLAHLPSPLAPARALTSVLILVTVTARSLTVTVSDSPSQLLTDRQGLLAYRHGPVTRSGLAGGRPTRNGSTFSSPDPAHAPQRCTRRTRAATAEPARPPPGVRATRRLLRGTQDRCRRPSPRQTDSQRRRRMRAAAAPRVDLQRPARCRCRRPSKGRFAKGEVRAAAAGCGRPSPVVPVGAKLSPVRGSKLGGWEQQS